jgi:hypothetical protein
MKIFCSENSDNDSDSDNEDIFARSRYFVGA